MTASINTSMNARVWTMLILLSMLFLRFCGCDGPAPLTIVTFRVGIAAITLWGIN